MHIVKLFFVACCSLLCLAVCAGAAAQAAPPGLEKLSPALQQALTSRESVDYLVLFADTADLSAASTLGDKRARRQFVYDRLREQAQRTQAVARSLLEAQGIAFGEHYLLNALEVRGDLATARQLAAFPEVVRLDLNTPVHADLPGAPPENISPALAPASPASIEWNVSRVRAPDVWNSFGVHGEGIVVGTADTGVQWDHPALQPHYRGWDGASANHDYNWHDAIISGTVGICPDQSPTPCDGFNPSHGTHVTGIMVGDDGAGNQIGVAPGAKWIACRNMDNAGNGTPARYTECFEFMLAPYPVGGDPLTQGRPDLGADIINNSWTCPTTEGCTLGSELRAEVQKLGAAGILVVAAAGNSGGQGCGSINEPPAIYPETFSIGAVDINDSIAGFSSRGPVTLDGVTRIKPDASAPGVGVRSSLRGNIYGSLSGTSMASPHASGVAALLWSAVPSLDGNITQTRSLIEGGADPKTTTQGCGTDTPTSVPNNVFGFGIVNALAAIQNAPIEPRFTLTESSAQIRSGDRLTYTLHLANSYAVTATNLIITDRVPISTTYAPNSIGGTGADDSAAPLLRWNVGTVRPAVVSGTLTFTFAVGVNAHLSDGAVISNSAWLSSTQTGPVWSNSVSATVRAPRLDLLKTVVDIQTPLPHKLYLPWVSIGSGYVVASSQYTASIGDIITYGITLSNSGSLSATNLILTDTIDTHTSLLTATITATAGAIVSDTTQLTVTLASLAPNSVLIVTYAVRVVSAPSCGGQVTNQALAASNESDTLSSNQTSVAILGSCTSTTAFRPLGDDAARRRREQLPF